MENANTILFRSSSSGYIMTETHGKSNGEKWQDACVALGKHEGEYDNMANKESKSAIKKWAMICKQKEVIKQLEPIRFKRELSETCKTHLVDLFLSEHYGRKEEITNKFLEKGNEREEDSITLYSRVSKLIFTKNEEHLSNGFVKGTPDLFLGESIHNAQETIDTKTSWSAHTFMRAKFKDIEKNYYWQGVCYMWLTGAKKHTVAYCLVNGTAKAINDEKRRLAYSMNVTDTSAKELYPEYFKQCKQIEINHIFDIKQFAEENPYFEFDNDINEWSYDIPFRDRVFSLTFERNEEDISAIEKRITECREWMNENLF